VGLGVAFVFTCPIVAVPLAWVVLLRHNKPAGYAADWFDQCISGDGFSLRRAHNHQIPPMRCAMSSHAPNGFFAEGLMVFGALEKGGCASKGYVLQPPDLRGGSIAQLNAYQEKIRTLLANLSEGMRAQFQWTCNCDYRTELTRYFRETEKVTHPHLRRVRMARWERHWKKMHRRELRREQLVMFLSVKIDASSAKAVTREGLHDYYEKGAGYNCAVSLTNSPIHSARSSARILR
jgi:hypothetical protein